MNNIKTPLLFLPCIMFMALIATDFVWAQAGSTSDAKATIIGFNVPQLPKGDYVARYETDAGTSKETDLPFSVTQRLE